MANWARNDASVTPGKPARTTWSRVIHPFTSSGETGTLLVSFSVAGSPVDDDAATPGARPDVDQNPASCAAPTAATSSSSDRASGAAAGTRLVRSRVRVGAGSALRGIRRVAVALIGVLLP
ncbi:MAG: hypothetical protein AB7I24_10050 [Candidatus Nanopelagicales bacterium]|jgi:hypothetical protein